MEHLYRKISVSHNGTVKLPSGREAHAHVATAHFEEGKGPFGWSCDATRRIWNDAQCRFRLERARLDGVAFEEAYDWCCFAADARSPGVAGLYEAIWAEASAPAAPTEAWRQAYAKVRGRSE